MSAEIRKKALPYLRSGAVTVLTAATRSDADRPFEAVVRVQGHYDVHVVDLWSDGAWTCVPCKLPQPCQHIYAAKLVLGGAA